MARTVNINFSEQDLQDLQNGADIQWTYTQEDGEEIIVNLAMGDEEDESEEL